MHEDLLGNGGQEMGIVWHRFEVHMVHGTLIVHVVHTEMGGTRGTRESCGVAGRQFTVRGEAASFVNGVYVVDPGPPGHRGTRDRTRLIPVHRRVTVSKRRDYGSDEAAPVILTSVPVDSAAVPARRPVPMGTTEVDAKPVTLPSAGILRTAGVKPAAAPLLSVGAHGSPQKRPTVSGTTSEISSGSKVLPSCHVRSCGCAHAGLFLPCFFLGLFFSPNQTSFSWARVCSWGCGVLRALFPPFLDRGGALEFGSPCQSCCPKLRHAGNLMRPSHMQLSLQPRYEGWKMPWW